LACPPEYRHWGCGKESSWTGYEWEAVGDHHGGLTSLLALDVSHCGIGGDRDITSAYPWLDEGAPLWIPGSQRHEGTFVSMTQSSSRYRGSAAAWLAVVAILRSRMSQRLVTLNLSGNPLGSAASGFLCYAVTCMDGVEDGDRWETMTNTGKSEWSENLALLDLHDCQIDDERLIAQLKNEFGSYMRI